MNTFEQAAQVRYYRQAFADMPVGGPMEGAAYGEYLKSKGVGLVIGIVAAVATMGAGIGVMAAGTIAAQLSGGAMIAGGLMSGIGAVTGNKKLTKIGGVLALAGGIGAIGSSMATQAGWGGAFESGSGSSAITEFANSTKSVFSNIFSGGSETAAKEVGGEIAQTGVAEADAAETGAAPVVDTSLPTTAGAPTIENAGGANAKLMGIEESIPKGTLELSGGTTNPSFATPDQAAVASGGASSPQGAVDQFNLPGGTKKFGLPETPTGTTAPPTESKGLLAEAWDKLNTPVGKEMAMGALKMAGTALAAGGGGAKESAENLANSQSGLYQAKTEQTNVETELAKQKAANASAVPIGLDPRDPQYAAKKAAAQAAGYQTFDIATPAATTPVSRTPVQTQYTSSPARAA